MAKLKMCRTCLAEDIRLCMISKTHLQTIYESLVMMPFETGDRRPVLICYICCARLQNCYDLRLSCLQSEELFTHMLSSDLKPVKPLGNMKRKLSIVHPIAYVSVGGETEPPQLCDEVGVEEIVEVIESNVTEGDVSKRGSTEGGPNEEENNKISNDFYIEVIKEESDATLFENNTLEESPNETAGLGTDFHLDMTIEQMDGIRSDHIQPPTQQEDPNYSEAATSNCLKENEREESDAKPLESNNNILNDNATHQSDDKVKDSVHNGYQCDVCKKCFVFKCRLLEHIRVHTGEKPYKCNVCKKGLSRKSGLIEHSRMHTGEKPFKCDICSKSFPCKTYLNTHIRAHTGDKPYQCNVCNKAFSSKSYFKIHIRGHSDVKQYQCNVCKKCFSNQSTLTKHVRLHTDEKSYKCDICDKCFAYKSGLIEHVRIHTREKPYRCNICNRWFSHKSTLNEHLRVHTGEKPYKCEICTERFSYRNSLTQHTRLHTAPKPYKCNVCEECFPCKNNLIRHMCIRKHTVEKPYKCNVCKEGFSSKSHLSRHLCTQGKQHNTIKN